MSGTQMSKEPVTQVPTPATVDLKLEVVVIPVSDVDRAKRFYENLGWRVDADFTAGDNWRVVQMTPPGSPCSIHFGKGVTKAVPGSVQEPVSGGVRHRGGTRQSSSAVAPMSVRRSISPASAERACRAPSPNGRLLRDICHVQPSGRQQLSAPGDQDAASWTRTEQPRRRDSDRAPARGRAASRRVRTDRPEAPLVGLVRCLHRRARAGKTPEEAAKDGARHLEQVRG